jgi:hypothetical protein
VANAPTEGKGKRPEIDKLIARADRGDESALPALRESLSPEAWKQFGDLAVQARLSLTP